MHIRAQRTLDIAFDEDHCRVRKDNGPQHFAILRQIALNGVRLRTQLKQEKTAKRGLKGKRLLAAWNQDYLLKVLAGVNRMSNSDAFALGMNLPVSYRM